jgi:hypothetical protein
MDGTGAVTDTYDYDAWGNVVASTGTTSNKRRRSWRGIERWLTIWSGLTVAGFLKGMGGDKANDLRPGDPNNLRYPCTK